MKSLQLARLAAAAAIALASSGAFAGQDTATLKVTASVGAKCKLTAADLAFGSLDPTLATDATASTTATYKCTKGTAVTSFAVNSVTAGATGTSGSMAGLTTGNTDTIAYTITWTNPGAFTGDGLGASGTAKSVTLNGKILNANYVNVTPDSYSGTIGVAVNY